MITDEVRNKYLRDIEYFSKKIEQNPYTKGYYPLAFAYLQLQKYDNVIDACEKGLERHPDYMQLATLMGEAFLKKGLLEEARAILESVVKSDNVNFKALKLLGDIYNDEGKIDKAIENYKKAYKLSPESEELKRILNEIDHLEIEDIDSKKEIDDKYSIDADIDKIMDDIFKNVSVSQTEDNSKDGIEEFSIEDSLNMINQLSDKSKSIDKLMIEEVSMDSKEKILQSLQKILDNIEHLKRERQLL
jgi:tetratricopeptide (TPR) repeat protein